MKPFAAVVLSAALVAGTVSIVLAQATPTPAPSTSQPSASQPSTPPAPSAPSGRTDVNVQGSTDRAPDVNVQNRSDRAPDVNVKTDARDDSGAASPRGAGADRGRILGMNPTAAVILGAALLVVIIIALVAMTRGGGVRSDTHIDLDRRL